jgi:curved DNA-binding protein CbpA
VYSHGIKLNQGLDEYTDCLRVFALRPGVSLQRIKVAYRNAVKTCHPDLNPNSGEDEANQFIRLTKTYERLLRLHEERTGEK